MMNNEDLMALDMFNTAYDSIEDQVDLNHVKPDMGDTIQFIVDADDIAFSEKGCVRTELDGEVKAIIYRTFLGNVVVYCVEHPRMGSVLMCNGPEVMRRSGMIPYHFITSSSEMLRLVGNERMPDVAETTEILKQATVERLNIELDRNPNFDPLSSS